MQEVAMQQVTSGASDDLCACLLVACMLVETCGVVSDSEEAGRAGLPFLA